MQLVHERGRPSREETMNMIIRLHEKYKIPIAQLCKEFGTRIKETTIQKEIERRVTLAQ